jgi:hypothetical protein
LLRASGDYEKVVLSPLPRYVKTCCSSKDHLVNRTDPNFKSMLYDGLEDINKSLHDLIGGKKICNFKVMSPMKLLDAVQDITEWTRSTKKFWSTDPVHLTPEVYEELTKVVTAEAVGTEYDRAKGGASTPQLPPPKLNPKIFQRQGWVSTDDTTAHRVYQQPTRGWGNRGQRGHRGQRGGGRGTNRGGKPHHHHNHKRGQGGAGCRSWPY